MRVFTSNSLQPVDLFPLFLSDNPRRLVNFDTPKLLLNDASVKKQNDITRT